WTLRNILNTGFSLHPFVVIRNFSREEKAAVKSILSSEKFDIIHAETFYVSPHIPKTNIPIVLVEQTIEYEVYNHYVKHYRFPILKPLLFVDVLKIKFWEIYYWKRARRVVAVSDDDAKVMRSQVKGLRVTVVPNGVGEDLIQPVHPHFNYKILFIGNYDWLQNAEAARILAKEVFPRIKKELPDSELIIAGQNTEKIQDLKSGGITLNDFAVDDVKSVQSAFRTSGVLVAPLYGPGGTRLKILSAMAAHLPVVTTTIGNQGIVAVPGESIMRGETSEQLADATIKLLQDKKLYEKIARNARTLVENNYSYNVLAKKLSGVYKDAKS
ncbi:glycosyltransferase family 4 protein, partial [Candidatus Microgenomates bacterium]|nr:glycosyltransferase family 4 protein [Candidatus Microgenomates bacterium]